MNTQEHSLLLAERGSLRRLLADVPSEDVIDRMTFESRLNAIDKILAITQSQRAPVRAKLTFRGRPVVGTHGIFAEFGMNASKAFTDVVARMAASLFGPLAPAGPIPDRNLNQLLITNTALGSFGFEFEEQDSSLFPEDSPVALALEQTQDVLRATVASDEDLADALAGTDVRVLNAIRVFLKTLADGDAVCTLAYRNKSFGFTNVGEVRRSLERLGQDNLHEEMQEFVGEFQGVLPNRRTFEFKVATDEVVIAGKIGPGISDPDTLNLHLHTRTTIKVIATRVGNGRPRYLLNQTPVWH